jgi:PPM family protein phosphatase
VSPVVLRAGAATHVGRLRTINQDSYALLPDRDLFVVADGMGGHQGGEVASRLAIETLQVAYQDATTESLADAIAVANHRIRNEGDADPNLRGMGTTVVALALLADESDVDSDDDDADLKHLVIANVGDSRAYLFRDGGLTQVT